MCTLLQTWFQIEGSALVAIVNQMTVLPEHTARLDAP
jgi:hypothetical protein